MMMAGILVFDYLKIPLFISFGAVFAVAYVLKMSMFHFRKVYEHAYVLSILVLVLYFTIGGLRMSYANRVSPHSFNHRIKEVNVVLGTVIEQPVRKNRLRAVIEVNYIGDTPFEMFKSKGKILIYFPKSEERDFLPGSQFFIHSSIQEVIFNKNPHSFNYKAYLSNRGIDYQIFLNDGEYVYVGDQDGVSLGYLLEKWRMKFVDVLDEHLEEDKNLGVASAMILGYRNKLPEDLYEAYTETGAVHTLAVSGLHVGIVVIILSWLIAFVPKNQTKWKIVRIAFLLTGIWLFAMITGGSPSILRACTMFTFFVFDFYWSANKNIYNSLSVAAICMLLYDPKMIYQASFQFSFLALLGIVVFYRNIYTIIPEIKQKWIQYIWGLGAVSVAAQITVFPITVYYFHKFPSYFWLSSMIAIPMAFVILSLGIALLAFTYFLPFLTEYTGLALEGVISVLNSSILFIQKFPYSNHDNIWVEKYEILLIYLAVLFLAFWLRFRKMKAGYLCLTLFILIFTSMGMRSIFSMYQARIMVYDIFGATVIDVIDGKNIYSYKYGNIDEMNEEFMCKNYRISKNARIVTYFELNDEITTNCYYIKHGHIVNKNQSVVILQDEPEVEYRGKVDVVIITSRYSGNPESVINNYRPRLIIVDKSLKYVPYEEWMNYKPEGIEIRSTQEEGAIEIQL